MKVIRCELAGLLVIEPDVWGDSRGFFMESWHEERYREHGLDLRFVQDNLSFSRQGAVRGLHFQNPAAQAKLVTVLQGEVFDVAVDLRRTSATFGRWHGLRLSSENRQQFFIPAGFAHGFTVLSESALFQYKCSEFYSPKDELTIRWDDPDLGIAWPVREPVLSSKDAQAPRLRDVPPARLFE